MEGKSYSKTKVMLSVFAMGFGGGAIWIIPYIKFVFYDLQMEVTGMNNTQSALLLSVLAVTDLIISVPVGTFVDKLDPKKVIIFSHITTTCVTLLYAFTFTSFAMSCVIWFLLACFTQFNWVAFSKILNTIGLHTDNSGSGKSGMSFGFYYKVNGISAAIIEAIMLWGSTLTENPVASFRIAVCIAGVGTILAAIFSLLLLDRELITVTEEDLAKQMAAEADKVESITGIKGLKLVLTNPMTYVFAITSICCYALYSLQGYFTPYLTSVVGISAEQSGIFAIIRTYVFFALAPIGGILADKVFGSTSRWISVSMAIMAVIVAGFFFIPSGANAFAISAYTLLPSAFVQMTYTIRFSCINELNISPALLATSTGVFALFGSLVDTFLSPAIAHCLDVYGNDGYEILFKALIVILLVGCFFANIIATKHKKEIKAAKENA